MPSLSLFTAPTAPSASSDPEGLAGLVRALFASTERPAPITLPEPPTEQPPADPPEATSAELSSLRPYLSGLGTSAARLLLPDFPSTPDLTAPPSTGTALRFPDIGTGFGTAAARIGSGSPAMPASSPPETGEGDAPAAEAPPEGGARAESGAVAELYCPPAVRDNVALGEEVNDALVEWADQVGIYPGQLDKVEAANFGRLIMLTHPGTDDPDRLLAAAKCILSEWATDDHFMDDESLGADAETIASRLGITYAAYDPADLPVGYAAQLDQAHAAEPVAVAYQSAFGHIARYATGTQVARLQFQLCIMFLAYNHEAEWRRTKRTPTVWEYLLHRFENSFLPPMILVDPVAGYELSAMEWADRRVRRVFGTAGLASVILNDVYSMATESDADFDLPKVIAAEEGCTAEQALERAVQIHNELMHRYEAEASQLSLVGSPALKRFLADLWAWLGGNREWHATTKRYHR